MQAPCQRSASEAGSSGRLAPASGPRRVSAPLQRAACGAQQRGAQQQLRRQLASPAAATPARQDAGTSATAAAGEAQQQQPQPAAAAALASSDSSDADVLIEFRNVYKSFGSKQILRGASFKIRRGEAVGIIGSSGTGKSTALRIAAGLLQPDKGEVLIKGEARKGLLSDHDTSDQLKVGLVFQSGALFDSLTVGENVGFILYEHSTLPQDQIQALVADSLSKVGLSGVEKLYPSELSGGMKKRVALARAIIRDTENEKAEQLIMYDEPTAGLDPVASTVIEDLIRSMHSTPTPAAAGGGASDINDTTDNNNGSASPSNGAAGGQGTTKGSTTKGARSSGNGGRGGGGASGEHAGITSYVVVTHQHSTIRRAVDRIIFLHDGVVAWEGSADEFDNTDEPIVRQFASGSLDGPITYV